MYAKLVVSDSGEKTYLTADEDDTISYRKAEEMLATLADCVPQEAIQAGHNTNQPIRHNYRFWRQMFNARQLASLGLLVSAIKGIDEPSLRSLFACLFSGVLEFNNMFVSYKGEGTGAVRHMFSHHILKPELTPLEANVWGTPKSSGSFSTLFNGRIMRALRYKASPFEIMVKNNAARRRCRKVYGLSPPVNLEITKSYRQFCTTGGAYVSQGDSSQTDIGDCSVDVVVTDPPFFDNVHYSELADFFFVWLKRILDGEDANRRMTTRCEGEVQGTDAKEFSARLRSVFAECRRVLKRNGLLVFTYHHSRMEGWVALYRAVRESGFLVARTYPVKSEMSVALPIQKAKTPVRFDLIVVCRTSVEDIRAHERRGLSLPSCAEESARRLKELRNAGIDVSLGDIKVILMGCLLSQLSGIGDLTRELLELASVEAEVDNLATRLWADVSERNHKPHIHQGVLFSPRTQAPGGD